MPSTTLNKLKPSVCDKNVNQSLVFTARLHVKQGTVLPRPFCLSVCLSVCLSNACFVTKRYIMNADLYFNELTRTKCVNFMQSVSNMVLVFQFHSPDGSTRHARLKVAKLSYEQIFINNVTAENSSTLRSNTVHIIMKLREYIGLRNMHGRRSRGGTGGTSPPRIWSGGR